ncbi:MAG: hypothetical protein KF823_09720 [Xanthomonadales bacterium]|nr:hypothetical protein [Xanthomonadales bacterium]
MDLPFAGRVNSNADLLGVFRGDGSIREEQCTVWRVFSHLIAEDLVGAQRLPDVLDVADRAGFHLGHLQAWLAEAIDYTSRQTDRQVGAESVDPRFGFMRMDWHPIRQLQYQSRAAYSSLHQARRFWSLRSRTDHEAIGGTFSRFERNLSSPLGPNFLPWLDTRRFYRPNPQSTIVRRAYEAGVPMITGASGVGMHTHQFARVLGIDDTVAVRLVAIAYLVPILQHSIYEVWISERSDAPEAIDAFSYADVLPVDIASFNLGPAPEQVRAADTTARQAVGLDDLCPVHCK